MADPDRYSHCVTELIPVPARHAFEFLCDGNELGRWSIGCWDTRPAGDGVFSGTSQYDGVELYAKPVGDAATLSIDFHVGMTPSDLTPRIMARVVPGDRVGYGANECLVTLLAWRGKGVDDQRWWRLVTAHETEIRLIKALLERDAGHAPTPLRADSAYGLAKG